MAAIKKALIDVSDKTDFKLKMLKWDNIIM